MTTTFTIRNDFHNSSTTARVGDSGELRPWQIKRIRKALCGISGCTCGGNLGERGPQDCDIDFRGYRDGDLVIVLSDKAEVPR